jgi:hypothetical protein
MSNDQTPEQLDALAAQHRQEAQDSFDRCDTDGFLSQWAHGITAQKAELQAEILRDGGLAEFPALYDLEGARVPAKLITVKDKFRFGRPKSLWALIDPANPNGKYLGFVPRPSRGVRSIANLRAKGYVEGTELAPAEADIVGTGTGLSGSAWAVKVRTDRGW